MALDRRSLCFDVAAGHRRHVDISRYVCVFACVPVAACACVSERARVCASASIEAHDPHDCFAAGVTWTSRTLKAGWAARAGHTSVVDAISGAIYVIGGSGYGTGGSFTTFQDVWVSTDGGSDRTRAGGACGGGTTEITCKHANKHARNMHIYIYIYIYIGTHVHLHV
jgi:hypothetical protein